MMNNIKKGNQKKRALTKRMKGGEDLKSKSIFKISTFKYLVSLLFIISYILFAIATIIFINACINLHKTTMDNPYINSNGNKKLIDAPIFEYLKENNFLVVDKFLLNADSSLKPTSIIFWVILAIFITVIILLFIYWYFLNKTNDYKTYRDDTKNEDYHFLIAFLPYVFIFVIVFLFNRTQINNKDILDGIINNDPFKKNKDGIIKYNKDNLQEIKIIIQKNIDNNTTNVDIISTFGKYITTDSTKSIGIDIPKIFEIYKSNYTNKNNDKHYTRKYINYIDEYFYLLKYNSDNEIINDYYEQFYLIGLKEFNKPEDFDNPENINIYNKLDNIKNKIKNYFIFVIALYAGLCFIALIIILIFNDTAKMQCIYILYLIQKGILPLIVIGLVAVVIFIIYYISIQAISNVQQDEPTDGLS